MPELDELTREELDRLYNRELLTDSQIAQRYGTYQVKISRLRKKWDIPTLDKTGRIAASLPDLTEQQRELVIGSLLGDGWMATSSRAAASFNEGHSLAQEDYCRWKMDLLDPYVSSSRYTEKVTEDKTYHGFSFSTTSCVQLRPYYDLFYPPPERERVFPENLPELITPFVLAIWYMDDGSVANDYHPRLSFGLGTTSLRVAVRALRELELLPELHEHQDGTSTLTFPSQADEFYDLVEPHIPQCMAYKVPDVSKRREQDRNASLLEPEVARTLYDGGMSCTEIADLYGVSRSTAWRRVHTDGEPTRMGRPRSSYSLEAARISLGNYDTSEWASLPEDEQDRWATEIYDTLTKTPFPYPTKHTGQEAQRLYQKLVDKDVFLTDDGEIRPRTPFGIRLCSGYFPNRFHAVYRDSVSAYSAWFDEKYLRRAVRIQLKAGDPVIPYRVRKAIQYQVRTPTVFRPGVAKYIYQTYAEPGDTVWDPCAGYGGRMLSALATGMDYIGTDVEPEVVEGNLELARTLGLDDRVDIQCEPAETFDLDQDVEVVFTSPPYFDREKYSGSDDQSWVKHGDSLGTWLEGFWRPIMQTAYASLTNNDGTFAVNICDLNERGKTIPLVSETIRLATEEGFEHVDTIKMPLANLSPRGHEPILIFRP